ncbi:mitochondrial large subunit ribosomal protein-domain-containing protein [Exophiala viscosa]|uniref:Large ribosomal subunit protein mL49 n=1 Tax=Exophiala viscosa TaxID=2486360 RepID=A0AAN6DPW5_9EURO|nr:mitochondrial large subunit ribosomal protein-domain-containing protein [Exophiala viscosa]
MKAPSTLLLRALLRPGRPLCQIRSKSYWMPREKYAKITGLDKLHRRQKEGIRREHEASRIRAEKMKFDPTAQPAPIPQQPSTVSPILEAMTTVSNLPFKISRTPSANLPVYESVKSGGSKHITTIRKITGDLDQLAGQVQKALGLGQHIVDVRGRRKDTVAINRTTRQVVVRGWRGPEIKKWAEMVGF